MQRRTAVEFVVLVGVVSLLADATYEGARSITGPFLATLGASATVVGVVAGFGELIGYGLRLVSGYLGDRTGRYWAITLWGYALNISSGLGRPSARRRATCCSRTRRAAWGGGGPLACTRPSTRSGRSPGR
jgi:hypothetical protein